MGLVPFIASLDFIGFHIFSDEVKEACLQQSQSPTLPIIDDGEDSPSGLKSRRDAMNSPTAYGSN